MGVLVYSLPLVYSLCRLKADAKAERKAEAPDYTNCAAIFAKHDFGTPMIRDSVNEQQ